jgi:hypothetical protein
MMTSWNAASASVVTVNPTGTGNPVCAAREVDRLTIDQALLVRTRQVEAQDDVHRASPYMM